MVGVAVKGTEQSAPVGVPTGAVDRDLEDRIEVRLMGPLQVRRTDGTLVHPREWRTGKTVDLLRLLALRSGQAVSVDEILEALWPDVDDHKGRGSLRNALGQLRKLLGQHVIERRPDGILLRDAWVDTVALVGLATEARHHTRDGRLALAVRVAREADALHLGEVRTHDPDALWAAPVREHIEAQFREMILDAAESAVELGWMRDALDLGRRALDADATSERAHRVLMRAYAGLGETEQALRTYERCRAVLAEDLGLDPAPQTRSLHVQILSAEQEEPEPLPFVGRDREVELLVNWFTQSVASGTPGVAYLSGSKAVGRTRLVQEAAQRVGADVRTLEGDVSTAAVLAALDRGPTGPTVTAGRAPLVVLLASADRLSAQQRQELLREVSTVGAAVVLVLRLSGWSRPLVEEDLEHLQGKAVATMALELLPLAPAAIDELATVLLSGPPSAGLLEELTARTDGLPGLLVETVDGLASAGELAATAEGLALVPPRDAAQSGPEVAGLLARALEHTSAMDQYVLHLVALLDRPVRPGLLGPLMAESGPTAGDVTAILVSMDRLADLQLLTSSSDGYCVRDPFLRQAIESWLRPSVRRRLHARIAGGALIRATERARHWRAAGEVELASAAAIDAVREAMAVSDLSGARAQLLVVTELAERMEAAPTDIAELEESLGDVCAAAGRIEEGVEHYRRAAEWSGDVGPEVVARLNAKAVQTQRLQAKMPRAAEAEVDTTPAVEVIDPADDEAHERAAWQAVERADHALDAAERVRTRLRLTREHLLPGRRLWRASEVTAEAIELAAEGVDKVSALCLHHLPHALLGNARIAEPALDAAWSEVAAPGPEAALLALLRCLVGHDLGRRDFDERWTTALAAAPPGSELDNWTWARVRILTERGSLAEALVEDRRPLAAGATPLDRQLRALATAGLLAALGRAPEAVSVLRDSVSDAEEEGCSLLMPEVTAKMIVLTAPSDPAGAVNLFELFDWAVGAEIGHPREGFLRLLARAAVRAGNQELDRAAASAANAARVAQDSGLLLLASEAYLAQAQYLFEGGWPAGARVATAGAARCLRAAGTAG